MNRTLRRLYSLFAIVVFCLVAPLVVAWTSGYQWASWRSGFIKVGAIFLTSDPHATVVLNGRRIGETPQHMNRLLPGKYQLVLERPGYGSWSRDITVQSGIAQVIGPVYLYPASLRAATTPLPTEPVLATDDHRDIFSFATNGDTITANAIWPDRTRSYTLPWMPTRIEENTDRQLVMFQRDSAAAIFTRTSPTPWIIEGISDVTWDSTTPTIFYGLQNNRLVRFDALGQQNTTVAIAHSYSIIGDSAWFTQAENSTTTIFRIKTFGQSTPDTVMQLDGAWHMLKQTAAPVIQHDVTHETAIVHQSLLTAEASTSNLGPVDTLWWPATNQPPLWLHGNDFESLDANGQTVLLDRILPPVAEAAWIVPNHIVLLVQERNVRLQSVSLEQGRNIIVEQSFDQPLTTYGLDLAKKTLVLADENSHQLQTLHW